MNETSSEVYKLMWRGRELGPLSLDEIRRGLALAELNTMYQVQVGGIWIPLRDFLETLNERNLVLLNSANDVARIKHSEPTPPKDNPAESWMSSFLQQQPEPSVTVVPSSSNFRFATRLGALASLLLIIIAFGMLLLRGSKDSPTAVAESIQGTEAGQKEEEKSTEAKPKGNDKLDLQQALQLWEGDGSEETAAQAVEVFKRLAENGDLAGQFYYGYALFSGRGIRKDVSAGVSWWKKAAERNQSSAQYLLGCAYYTGEGEPLDKIMAVEWLTKSAMLGHSQAQFLLSLVLLEGDGAPKDVPRAAAWMMLSAQAGWSEAQKVMSEVKKTVSRNDLAKITRLAKDIQSQILSVDNLPFDPALVTSFMGQGTGFFVTADGYLATNHHVVDKANLVKVKTSKGLKSARLVLTDPLNDLAILKVEGAFTALPIQSDAGVSLGATVSTVGFPTVALMGYSPKYAKGEITSLAGIMDDQRQYQISVPVQPGNSGGALVNSKGNVVGVVSAKLDMSAMLQESSQLPENVNYAMKSSLLLGLLKKIPDAIPKLLKVQQTEGKPDEVVQRMENSSVLILVK
jgi:S1-C subfamily serine protease